MTITSKRDSFLTYEPYQECLRRPTSYRCGIVQTRSLSIRHRALLSRQTAVPVRSVDLCVSTLPAPKVTTPSGQRVIVDLTKWRSQQGHYFLLEHHVRVMLVFMVSRNILQFQHHHSYSDYYVGIWSTEIVFHEVSIFKFVLKHG